MTQPFFDVDLKRVSRTHYITGKAAINYPYVGSTTGGWHFLSYFDRGSGVAKVSLAFIHYPDATDFFGDTGIIDVTDELAARGWKLEGRLVFIADHYRAAVDLVIKWALSDSTCCNGEIADWFPRHADRQRLSSLLYLGKQRLLELGRLQRLEAWLAS